MCMGGGIMREIWDDHHIPDLICWVDIDIINKDYKYRINMFYKKKYDQIYCWIHWILGSYGSSIGNV